MSAELKNALQALVQNSADEFFSSNEPVADYRFDPKESAATSVAVTYASVIGYSGDTIKGSLVITCERDFLDKSHPNHMMGMPVGEPEILDWIGEIANQMLGRIKNKLATAGVAFSMGTPTTVSGKSMQINPPKDGFALPLLYRGKLKDFQLYFLTVVDPAVKIASIDTASSGASEGASILF